ncbi:hypothetical protein M0J40_RS10290 [Providencia rettgeri]|nr:hypothetical protein [Providencia rettgeri]ELR5124558.1 hypothetical protein [Providencia rettgeri]ELR5245244.1 hypothetical protein [Providencia rettgeri]ELS4582749.1 hypothetical protein [Providencia rettgeri]
MIDKMDLALLKQEIVDWHEVGMEGCELMKTNASMKMEIPGMDVPIEFKLPEELVAFKIGVALAQFLFCRLPFEVESDEGSSDE